ncbi:MAG: EAL domain-containing protein [Deltaproteobacteria bacterium]|jgi:diguanylate cyclase (GGDEF)-like protein|nr:EAL domain-containing protein [Deltaproteobacteria bacterium]MBW2530396.1 EAL domain-containing protein [Deltaproteobacteria bacterium]
MTEADRTAAEIAAEMRLSDEEIARRLDLLQLTEAERARLAALASRIDSVADRVVDSFYGRMQAEHEMRRLLPDDEVAGDLKERLRAYLLAMFAGPHDQSYVSHRLLVGVTHQQNRITPKWYISASSWLLSALLDSLYRPWRPGELSEVAEEVSAIIKILLFDLSLVLETYFHADHQAIEKLATHDQLTGLPNYYLLEESLRQRHGGEQEAPVCVLLVGLDRFKAINATLGHELGDRLLEQVAARLSDRLAPAGMVARLGGDLFVVLCEQCGVTGVADAAMERILGAFERPFELDELAVNVNATVGVAVAGPGDSDASTLLRRAEAALLHAKAQRAAQALYEPEMNRYSVEQVRLIGELRQAIAERQLVLYYQPKIDVAAGRVCGVEALVRWRHPAGELRLPSRFIPLAEQTILIHPVTEYVLCEAAAQASRWREQGIDLPVSVNVAAPNLLDAALPARLESLIAAHQLPAKRLVLELTESTLMADPVRARETLERLAALGCALSIDDFGTGYSSLAYLRNLPVDEIKLDCVFVMGMVHDEQDARIVESTIGLAHGLGLVITAEGVESEKAWTMLRQLGCDRAQGFHLGRPMPVAELERWLDESPLGRSR